MANYFIFGIGGTGSRVIRSFTMLLAAGFKPFKANDKVFPILIDYDTTNGDTVRTLKLIDCYHNIHKAAYPAGVHNEQRCNDLFFSTPLREMREISESYKSCFAMEFGTDNDQTFEQWTGMGALTDEKVHTCDLMNSLFDDSSDDDRAEIKLNMFKGFKGNPNIGSIVFHSLKGKNEFKEFARLCGQGDKVIIVGSLFGGTGSSGIPELVKAIRNHEKPVVKAIDLSVVMVCPYFDFTTDDNRAVRASIFNSKTKAALNFYKDSGLNHMINAIYYIGDNNKSSYKYCEGSTGQKNDIHIVDLVGALSICHFAENTHTAYDPMKERGGDVTQYFKYRLTELKEDERQSIGGDENNVDAAHGLNFTNFMEKELKNMFLPLASFALALRFFHDEVANNTKVVKDLDWYKTLFTKSNGLLQKPTLLCFDKGQVLTAVTGDERLNELRACCDGLMKFYGEFVEWNNEFTKHSKDNLRLFNFKGNFYDLIVGGSLRGQLDAEDDVAECTKNAWNNDKKNVTTFGVESKFTAFMLMRILTEGCRDVMYKDEKSRRTTARLKELDSKMLRVVKPAIGK